MVNIYEKPSVSQAVGELKSVEGYSPKERRLFTTKDAARREWSKAFDEMPW